MKKSIITGIILPFIIEPVVSFVFGLIICNILSFEMPESMIFSALCTVFVALIDINIRNQVASESSDEKISKIESKICEISVLSKLHNKLDAIDHPYFRKHAFQRLLSFINSNEDFFNGTNITNPHADDTFGIAGIMDTCEGGNIKAVSSIKDYWSDSFTTEYLRGQEELIKKKNVTIQRIFFLSKSNFDSMKKLLKKQKSIGIEVYYFFCENEYIDPKWKDEDFLIQDNRLLVQVSCSSHKYDASNRNVELITLNESAVSEKRDTFSRMLERAKKF